MARFYRFLASRIFAPRQLATIRSFALAVALPVVLLAIVVLSKADGSNLISHGPIQSGHEDLACSDCHARAEGTLRQQIQANLKFHLGWHDIHADFGFAEVDSDTCITCHERPNDRHPIYRFREPRFAESLELVEATSCLGCHAEHADERVNVELTFCVACHEDLRLKVDPLDVSHVDLIAAEEWGSCLGCHDFHGNHAVAAPVRRAEARDVNALIDYLKNGPDPYAADKIYKAVSP